MVHEREQQAERIEHERDEHWRDRLTNAAGEFSTGSQQALLRIHEAIQAADAAVPTADLADSQRRAERFRKAVVEADRVIGEAIARIGVVSLVFGSESEANRLVEEVVRQLEKTINQVKSSPPDVSDGWKEITNAYISFGHDCAWLWSLQISRVVDSDS